MNPVNSLAHSGEFGITEAHANLLGLFCPEGGGVIFPTDETVSVQPKHM